MLLVLWDIDHTLTENHGVNKEIYAYAFELLTGRNGGAHVVGVATGPDSVDALLGEGADIALPDLRDTQAVVRSITGFAR